MLSKDEKPPTSKKDAVARRVRPPPEKYEPEHWSITETLAWIIWRDLDAVRNEWDDYRNGCADWIFVPDATARAKVAGIAMKHISTGKLTRLPGKLARLPKKLRKDFQKGSWQLREWGRSGWNTLRASEHMRPQVAIEELWKAAGEGRIKAIAIECKNAKAFDGNQGKIPARHWAYLTRDSEPSGKPILSGRDRVYREVRFLQLDVKKLWPKSPLLPDESREGEEVHGAGVWITAEAKRMKEANEIPPDITITDLARVLERRMQKAATTNKSLRPITWRSIKNKLPEWGLWPVTSIK
jgi:hypothetical protein